MEFDEIKNGSDLVCFVENWTAFNGAGYDYDINGLLAILRACLRNLNRHAIEGDYEEVDSVFDADERAVILKLAASLGNASADGL